MADLTPDEIARGEALLASATDGPWAQGCNWRVAGTHPPIDRNRDTCAFCDEGDTDVVASWPASEEEIATGKDPRTMWHLHRNPGGFLIEEEWVEGEESPRLKPGLGTHRVEGPRGRTVAGNYDYESGGIVRDEDAKAIVWLRNNAAALIAAAKERDELQGVIDDVESVSGLAAYSDDEEHEAPSLPDHVDGIVKERDELRAEVERLRSGLTSAEQAAEQARQAAKLDRVALRVLLTDLAAAKDLTEFRRIQANAATMRKPAVEGDPMVPQLAAEVERLRGLLTSLLAASEPVADALRDIAADGHDVYLTAYESVVNAIENGKEVDRG